VALEYPSDGVRRITVILHESGIIISEHGVGIYRLKKLANFVRKKRVSEKSTS
jgi:hypothetical protein